MNIDFGDWIGNWYLDGKGEAHPVPDWPHGESVERWARWYEVADRRVAKDVVGDYVVSTIFLSVNMNFGLGPPILWETAIFKDRHLVEIAGRYASKEQAVQGHTEAVDRARSL